jgi:hypothetical protein
LKPYIRQEVDGKVDVVVLIGGAEKWATIQWEKEHMLEERSCQNSG